MQKQDIIIYEKDWKISVDILIENKTFWMTNLQISQLFWKSKWTISEHIKNIYDEWEFLKKTTVWKNQTVQKEWNRKVERELEYYNLDIILAIWYRVKSKQWIQFRKWATGRLKEYLTDWFSINDEKIISWKTTEYFDKLQDKLREILSFCRKYGRITNNYENEWLDWKIRFNFKDELKRNFRKLLKNFSWFSC